MLIFFFTEQQNEEKKKQKAKNQDNPLSRIPGLRDASKKQAKIVRRERERERERERFMTYIANITKCLFLLVHIGLLEYR